MKIERTHDGIILTDNGTGGLVGGLVSIAVGVVLLFGRWLDPGMPLWVVWGGGAAFVGVGVTMCLRAKRRVVSIPRGKTVRVTTTSRVGKKSLLEEFAANTVARVRLRTVAERDTGRDGARGRISELSLVLDNNDLVVLARKRSQPVHVGSFDLNALRRAPLGLEARAVADVLEVELDAVDSSSMVGAISTIRDAIAEVVKEHKPRD